MFLAPDAQPRPALRRTMYLLLGAELVTGVVLALPRAPRPPALPLRTVTLIQPYLPPPPSARTRQRPETAARSKSATRPPAPPPASREEASPPPAAPHTLSAQFEPYAARGERSSYHYRFVVAVNSDWTRVLAARGGALVFCPMAPAPGSPVLLYDLATGRLSDTDFQPGQSLRQVDDPAAIPGLPMGELLGRARAHFRSESLVFVVYPRDLLWAMQGKAEHDLEARRIDLASIREVTARYVYGPAGYDVVVEGVR